jgi:hypothetical protein
MCFGGENPGASAANAQTQMMENQNRKHDKAVSEGKFAIDDAFKSFDDGYYRDFAKTYRDNFNPSLDDMYGKSRDKLVAILAGRDTLDSSIGADSLAQQSKVYGDTRADIASKSQDAAAGLKSTVDRTKGDLYSQNAAVADPLTMATQAQASVGALVNPASYPSLSNVFADGLSAFSTAARTNRESLNPWSSPQQQNGTGASGQGSAIFSL